MQIYYRMKKPLQLNPKVNKLREGDSHKGSS